MSKTPEPVVVARAGLAAAAASAQDASPGAVASAGQAGARAGAVSPGGEPEPVPGWDVQFQASLHHAPDEEDGSQP